VQQNVWIPTFNFRNVVCRNVDII